MTPIPPFKSDIFYSVQNEDYQTELAVLQRNRRENQRVLLVASSGENALSLLTSSLAGTVHAVDINPAQLHLCDLRRGAAEQLTQEAQFRLLGIADPSPENAKERLTLYDQLRPRLTEDSRKFWDDRRDREVSFGIHHVGRNDIGMQDVRVRLKEAGFAPLDQPLNAADLPRWKGIYEALMTPAYIQNLFGLPSQALGDKIASIAGYLGECHFHAAQHPNAAQNPFVTTVFKGAYPLVGGETGLPLYLQKQGQQRLRQRDLTQALKLHVGNILDWITRISQTDGPLDLISLSNIADWMTESEFSDVVVLARGCLSPGGALLARTATPRRMIESVMRQHLKVDEQFNIDLQNTERGPWFRVISAGFRD